MTAQCSEEQAADYRKTGKRGSGAKLESAAGRPAGGCHLSRRSQQDRSAGNQERQACEVGPSREAKQVRAGGQEEKRAQVMARSSAGQDVWAMTEKKNTRCVQRLGPAQVRVEEW